jgi:hypothetical protein
MIPAASRLRSYKPQWFRSGLAAGLTLLALGDPSLAGLPTQAGLYPCLFGGWSFGFSAARGDPSRLGALAACSLADGNDRIFCVAGACRFGSKLRRFSKRSRSKVMRSLAALRISPIRLNASPRSPSDLSWPPLLPAPSGVQTQFASSGVMGERSHSSVTIAWPKTSRTISAKCGLAAVKPVVSVNP